MLLNDKELTEQLKQRQKRYQTAVAMAKGKIPTDSSFKWPFYPGYAPKDPKNVLYWNGCLDELDHVLKDIAATDSKNCRLPLNEQSSGIHIKGQMGTWHVIGVRYIDGQKAFLLEHELYGGRANLLLVDKDASLIERIDSREVRSYEDDYYDEY